MSLPQPVGRQKEVLYLPSKGHTVVLGTAGSGKTTLAIHRSLYLANPDTDHHGYTLLVTFNRCLVAYLRSLSDFTQARINVENYHKFARGYLNARNKMRQNCICSSQDVDTYCKSAIRETLATGKTHPILERPIQFLVEEFKWLAQHGITTVEDYEDRERVGRTRTRVTRKDRRVVFDLYERYKIHRAQKGKDYDWDDLSHSVLSELRKDTGRRLYRHIVIDEGQDFSPMMLRSLAAAIPKDGSLTFFGDMAQQIYGNRMSWRNAGLNVSEAWKFEENYRNTKQVSRLALAIANMPGFISDPDLVEPKSPTADGLLPGLVSFPSKEDELKFIAERAQELGQTGSVAVLVRDRNKVRRLEKILPRNSTKLHKKLKIWPQGPGIFYGTYHSAKGLEFDGVLLPGMSAEELPYPPDVATFGESDALTRNLHLLYVAVTRARFILILTYTEGQTTLLPNDRSLYGKSHDV